MKINISSDHAGYKLKKSIINFLTKSHEVNDLGPNSEDSVDYPDFAHKLVTNLLDNDVSMGILICGSANGISMAANKHSNIRAAVCWNKEIAVLAKQHNDANVVSLPARFISENEAIEIIEAFIGTDFEGGRHLRRVNKINCV